MSRKLVVTTEMVLMARQLLAQTKGKGGASRQRRDLVKMARVRLSGEH